MNNSEAFIWGIIGVIGGIMTLRIDPSELKGYEERDVNPDQHERMIKLTRFIGIGMITLASGFVLFNGLSLLSIIK